MAQWAHFLFIVFLAAAQLVSHKASAQTLPPKLVIATINMPPHSIEDAAAPSFSRELFQRAMASQGYQVEIRFYPWARALELGKQGRVDAVWPSIHQKGREIWFLFGSPVIHTEYVLLKRRNFPLTFRGLEDARPYLIGTLRGGVTGSPLDTAPTSYRIEPADSFAQNLQKLAAGRIDLMTTERHTATHLLKTQFPSLSTQVEMLAPPISKIDLYLMFSTQAPGVQKKMQAFEKGLNLMRTNGELAQLLKRHGFDAKSAMPASGP